MEKEKKYIPFILATGIFMQMLDSTILNTSLPAIAADLHESPLDMQNAIVSYVLTLALFMPASGFLADRFGTKKIFILAVLVFTLGSFCCAISQNLPQLVVSRVLQGIGGAMITPVGKLAMIKSYSKNEIIIAMNYAIIPALIGPILGPLVGGYMVDYLSWHWIFLINIPIGLTGIILSIKYMPDFKERDSHFDSKGFLIFAAASLLLSLALEFLGESKQLSPILLMILLGFSLLYFYYRHAMKNNNALFPLELFKIRTFRVGFYGNMATRLGISAVPLLIPLMIQIAYGQSAVVSGWIVAPMALTAMLGKSLVVKILNVFGYRATLRTNTVLIGLLIMCFAIPSVSDSIYWFIPIVVLLGFFNSIQFTSMNTIAIARLRDRQNSSGNSLISVNQQLAIGFGIAFGMVVLRFFETKIIGNQTNIHQAFRYTFICVGLLTVLSSFVFQQLHNKDGNNMKTESQ
ncbi:MAG: MFS transporter [Capnocytophaga sp.]|nr:MFS transporter [Capnocytophaga sp.]